MYRQLLLTLFLSFLACSALAQKDTLLPQLQPLSELNISISGSALTLPGAGGLTAISASNIDFDQDGQQDLLVFDRAESRLLPLVLDSAYHFHYAPEYLSLFDGITVRAWVLLRDYDGDGDQDLFSPGANSGAFIDFYENVAPAGAQPDFVFKGEIETRYLYQTNPTSISKLYSTSVDIPGLADVDFDGDMDVLCYDVTGTTIEYHKNLAVEELGRTDTFFLVRASACWGHFKEVYYPSTNTYDMFLNQPACNEIGKTTHTGGGLLPINLNGDTLMDIVVSDVGVNYMIAGTNGGSRSIANLSTKDSLFPSTSQRVNLTTFPVGFYVDVTGEGINELIVSPNETAGVDNKNGIWLYDNMGTQESPVFMFNRKGFLQDQMFDLGSYAAPHFMDYDNDGDHDLLVGVGQVNQGDITTLRGHIHVLKNTGTDQNPSFVSQSNDYFQMLNAMYAPASSGLRLASADLDNDSDADLLACSDQGEFIYFENTTTGGNLSFSFVTRNYQSLSGAKTWYKAAPEFYDLDNDGDYDLLVGDRGGHIYYFENTGTPTNPTFTAVTDTLGGVVVSAPPAFSFEGMANPRVADYDFDGQPELLVSNIAGKIYTFDGLESALTDTMPQMALSPLQTHSTGRLTLAYLQTHADSGLVLAGARGGGMFLFRHLVDSVTTDSIPDTLITRAPLAEQQIALQLYPNPTSGMVTVTADQAAAVTVMDATGRVVMRDAVLPGEARALSLRPLAVGLYVIRLHNNHAQATRRIIRTE